jgi:hypothetical protein
MDITCVLCNHGKLRKQLRAPTRQASQDHPRFFHSLQAAQGRTALLAQLQWTHCNGLLLESHPSPWPAQPSESQNHTMLWTTKPSTFIRAKQPVSGKLVGYNINLSCQRVMVHQPNVTNARQLQQTTHFLKPLVGTGTKECWQRLYERRCEAIQHGQSCSPIQGGVNERPRLQHLSEATQMQGNTSAHCGQSMEN